MTDYQVVICNTSGARQAVITNFTSLAYSKAVNAPGYLQFSISGDNAILTSLADKWVIEVWRRPDGAAWYMDYIGLFRDDNWYQGENGSVFVASVPGILSMLDWRVVDWPAGTADRSVFSAVKAETVIKTIVYYNCGSAATVANGRKRAGVITGLSIETDTAAGNTVTWSCHGDYVLTNIQKLAPIAGGDFDLIKTAAGAYEFRWYTGQRGTDRSATVIFAMERGNMAEPQYSRIRSGERTVACVWGKGEGANRDYATRTGTNYNATTNNIEMYVNATDVPLGSTAGLNTRGDEKLGESVAKSEFRFTALQAPATRYGVDYDLGDLVTAINPYTGASTKQKVTAVNISMSDTGEEAVQIEFAESV